MTTPAILAHFDAWAAQLRATLEAKNADYGSSWEEMRPPSLTDQMLVKVRRIQQLETPGHEARVSEGIPSECLDIGGYAFFRWLKERESRRG
jgi:hypothetical protein